jgi:hypothetical protein
MTLGCARCHDHKFDPIPTTDYYGLAGVFKSTRTMENFKKVARWHEYTLGTEKEKFAKAEHEKRIADAKTKIKQMAKAADEAKDELKRLRDEPAALEKAKPNLPSVMGVGETTVTDVPVHIRGNHLKLGDIVPRHVPAAFAGRSPPTFDARQSGRLQLAEWITRPDHPLTARVMVNRIWRWHFGHGIVRTPDNFGRLGEAPTHPELLDWLAARFTESGWSMKAMHRLIMLSRTYQMGSFGDARAAQVDPENRLHSRAEVRRLEVEAIRDAMLAISGTLDPTTGGSLLHVKNREYLFNHTSRDATRYNEPRRSIYLPVVRNNTWDVFQLFDFPDPAVSSGDRNTTTVAPQALFLLNSDWILRTSEHLADRLGPNASDAGRVRDLYRLAYGRDATSAETNRALDLVREVEKTLANTVTESAQRRRTAWASLCQVVMSANEFVYVR